MQKLLTFFQQKFQNICVSIDVNFNESLTNDVVSFEQLGPDVLRANIKSTCKHIFLHVPFYYSKFLKFYRVLK